MILAGKLQQRVSENVGKGTSGSPQRLAGGGVKGGRTVKMLGVLLGIWVPSPLFREHMKQHGLIFFPGPAEHLRQLLHVVAVHRPHIGKTHLFKHGTLRQQGVFKPVLHMRAGSIQILLGKRVSLKLFFIPFFEIIIPFLRTDPGQVATETAYICLDRHAIVIKYDDHRLSRRTCIVEALKAQTAGHGAVSDQGQNTVVLMQERSCVGHAQSHGHRIGCMAGYKGIVRTFIGLWKTGKTAQLPQSTEK